MRTYARIAQSPHRPRNYAVTAAIGISALIFIALVGLYLRSAPTNYSVSYDVSMRNYDQGLVDVIATFGGHTPPSVIGRLEMGAHNTEVSGAEGSLSPAQVRTVEGATVLAIPPGTTEVHYSVRVGRRLGQEHFGQDSGYDFGHLGPDFGVMSGANLFLIPADYKDLGAATITIREMPRDWRLVTTLVRRPDGLYETRSDGADEGTAAELWTSLVALGSFEEINTVSHGDRISAYFPAGLLNESTRERLFETFAYLQTELGPLGGNYKVVLVPTSRAGRKIRVEPGAYGQVVSVQEWTERVWRHLNYNFVSAFTRFEPTGLLYRPGDAWLGEAIPIYLSLALSERYGDLAARPALHDAYQHYISVPAQTFLDLRQPPLGRVATLTRSVPRVDKLLLAAYLLDLGLTNHGSELQAEIRRIRLAPRSDRVLSLADVLRNQKGRESRELAILQELIEDPERILQPESLGLSFDVPHTLDRRAFDEAVVTSLEEIPRRSNATIRLMISGRTDGYLENCGCVLTEDGGIARRVTVFKALRSGQTPTLALDTGDFFPREQNAPFLPPRLARDLEFYLDTLNRLSYDAAALGNSELRYSVPTLKRLLSKLTTPVPVASNISDVSGNPLTAPYTVSRVAGGVLIVGAWEYKEPPRYGEFYEDILSNLVVEEPAAAVRSVLSARRDAQEFVIVLGNVSPLTARRIIDVNPQVDLIVTARRRFFNYDGLPATGTVAGMTELLKEDSSGFYRGALILYATLDSYGVSAADLTLDGGRVQRAKTWRVRLSSAIAEDRETRARLDEHYAAVKDGDAGPRIGVPTGAKAWPGNSYAGAEACGECHRSEFERWSTTRHAYALKTLLFRQRHLYNECVSCHVTGYAQATGYETPSDKELLGGVQCEACHGAGSLHVANPIRGTVSRVAPSAVCMDCHTPLYSPDFDPGNRREQAIH